MEEPKWIETKKECDVDPQGKLVVKKVTLELEKRKIRGFERKDVVDFTLRLVGLMAIGIPVLVFFFQQSAERDKQRALLQIEAYSNISILLHEIVENEDLQRYAFETKRRQVLHVYTPKIALYNNDDSLIYLLSKINNNLNACATYESYLKRSYVVGDSMRNLSEDVCYALGFKKFGNLDKDLVTVQWIIKEQKLLVGEIKSYKSGPSSDLIINTILARFDTLIMVHEELAEALYDAQLVIETTREIMLNIPGSKLQQSDRQKIDKLLPECYRLLAQSNRLVDTLESFQESSRNNVSSIRSTLERLDETFVESNRYLSP